MGTIIEKDGKFYIQQTTTGPEVTLTLLEDQLAAIKAKKDSVLAAKTAEYDARISEVESQIGEIRKLQKKPAKTPKKAPTGKAREVKPGRTGRRQPKPRKGK